MYGGSDSSVMESVLGWSPLRDVNHCIVERRDTSFMVNESKRISEQSLILLSLKKSAFATKDDLLVRFPLKCSVLNVNKLEKACENT